MVPKGDPVQGLYAAVGTFALVLGPEGLLFAQVLLRLFVLEQLFEVIILSRLPI